MSTSCASPGDWPASGLIALISSGKRCPPGPSGRGCERPALLFDTLPQLVPRFHELLCPILLQLDGERIDIDAGFAEALDLGLEIAAVFGQRRTDPAVVGECEQRLFRHRVDSVGGCQRLDVQRVGRVWILGPGARPKQALRTRSGAGKSFPAGRREHFAVRAIGLLRNRDTESIAQV